MLVVLALVLGCSSVPDYDIEEVRARSEQSIQELLMSIYDADAYGKQSRYAEIMDEYSDLQDPDLIDFVDALRREESDQNERRRLDYLYYDLVGTAVFGEVDELEDEVINLESSGTVLIDTLEIPFREIYLRMYDEKDSDLREKYYHADGLYNVEVLNPVRLEVVNKVRTAFQDLGFEDLAEFEQDRRKLDFEELELTIQDFLDETEKMYLDLTNRASHQVFGFDVTEIKDYDRGRLFRGAEFDRYFQAEGMMPLMKEALLDLGIDLESIESISVDDEIRENKEPRPATYPVVVGRDIRVLIQPFGGATDYESLFHEMGHALHDAYTEVEEFEFQRLGDYGVTEAYAFLLEDLISDEGFIAGHGVIVDPKTRRAYLENQLLSDLGSARYYCANFKYERVLHKGEADPIESYRTCMEEARLVPLEHPEYGYLQSNEEFYGVNYLEAWFLSAQIRYKLKGEFGDNWWMEPGAGEFMKELWAMGSQFSANEIAVRLGFDGLDSSYYIAELDEAYELIGN
jgi:hypothetical protein